MALEEKMTLEMIEQNLQSYMNFRDGEFDRKLEHIRNDIDNYLEQQRVKNFIGKHFIARTKFIIYSILGYNEKFKTYEIRVISCDARKFSVDIIHESDENVFNDMEEISETDLNKMVGGAYASLGKRLFSTDELNKYVTPLWNKTGD